MPEKKTNEELIVTLTEEATELSAKIEKLENAIAPDGIEFNERDRNLLMQQLNAMQQYATILCSRLGFALADQNA